MADKNQKNENKKEKSAVMKKVFGKEVMRAVRDAEAKKVIEENSEYPNFFNFLPDEMLTEIFKKMTWYERIKMREVCVRFKNVADDKSVWYKTTIENASLQPGVLGHVLENGVRAIRLVNLNLYDPIIDENLVKRKKSSWEHVHTLEIRDCLISQSAIAKFLDILTHLKVLIFDKVVLDNAVWNKINDKKLKRVTMSNCKGYYGFGLITDIRYTNYPDTPFHEFGT